MAGKAFNLTKGVLSFNGRTGAVQPKAGDYTADDVGARPNNWIPTAADVGAAPGGFGLGESSAKPIEDFNTAWRSGWYYTTSSDIGIAHWPDGMSQYCLVRTDCRGSSAYQTAYDSGKMAVRFTQQTSDPEAWQPWEWVNPPMLFGVSYRTTERWNENPIYVKNVRFTGALPNKSTAVIAFGDAIPFDTTQVVSLETVIVNATTNDVRTLPAFNDDGSLFATHYFFKYTDGSLGITVRTFDDASAWTVSSMVLKYAEIES